MQPQMEFLDCLRLVFTYVLPVIGHTITENTETTNNAVYNVSGLNIYPTVPVSENCTYE